MRVETVLTGISALIMKNVQMANPDYDPQRQVAAIVGKGSQNMTEVDRLEKARWQFLGSLYLSNGEVVIPSANLRRCFILGAVPIKRGLGKTVERAIMPVDLNARLEYPGPRDAVALWDDPTFRYTTMVNSNPNSSKKAMVPGTRPWFPKWRVVAEWELAEDVLDFDKFVNVVAVAGRVEGLGDNRKNGFGRFTGEVNKL